MRDLSIGRRVTVLGHVEGYEGQHGTVLRVDNTAAERPVLVNIDDDGPRQFDLDELGPYTGPIDTEQQLGESQARDADGSSHPARGEDTAGAPATALGQWAEQNGGDQS